MWASSNAWLRDSLMIPGVSSTRRLNVSAACSAASRYAPSCLSRLGVMPNKSRSPVTAVVLPGSGAGGDGTRRYALDQVRIALGNERPQNPQNLRVLFRHFGAGRGVLFEQIVVA